MIISEHDAIQAHRTRRGRRVVGHPGGGVVRWAAAGRLYDWGLRVGGVLIPRAAILDNPPRGALAIAWGTALVAPETGQIAWGTEGAQVILRYDGRDPIPGGALVAEATPALQRWVDAGWPPLQHDPTTTPTEEGA